jgi:hypothetical protein
LVGDNPTKSDAFYVAEGGPVGQGSMGCRRGQASQVASARKKLGELFGPIADGID